GASPHGQGQETSFAQIIADEFGIGLDDVFVHHGDTARIPYGIGTFGSRGTAVGGTAMYMAAKDLKTKLSKIAAHVLQSAPDKIVFENGTLIAKDVDKSMTFGAAVT